MTTSPTRAKRRFERWWPLSVRVGSKEQPSEPAASHSRAAFCARPCSVCLVRTTVEFDDDTAKAIDGLRREAGLGVSDAVNALIRRGLLENKGAEPFRQPTHAMGLKIDVSNVADALDLLEGVEAR